MTVNTPTTGIQYNHYRFLCDDWATHNPDATSEDILDYINYMIHDEKPRPLPITGCDYLAVRSWMMNVLTMKRYGSDGGLETISPSVKLMAEQALWEWIVKRKASEKREKEKEKEIKKAALAASSVCLPEAVSPAAELSAGTQEQDMSKGTGDRGSRNCLNVHPHVILVG
ncbi:hypothetical protein BT63DRAFT_457970 [Microthyrium microscopicum]|uniref:Uncharacterized protein n=1 Tax=Microthyrium microscopicum TaxID=703497 RepID=A0A6A6U6T9_9PEZI|nr:hypothetical protein BT63DRAFT_457970 [Microthyrium microscopicum]